jgi:hypothetical protein
LSARLEPKRPSPITTYSCLASRRAMLNAPVYT